MHTGRTPCDNEGRDGVIHFQAKELQKWPANHQKLEEKSGTDSPSQPQKEPTLLTPWSQTSGLQDCETIKFCCFCCFSHSVCGTSFCSPSKPIHLAILSSNDLPYFPDKQLLGGWGEPSETLIQLVSPGIWALLRSSLHNPTGHVGCVCVCVWCVWVCVCCAYGVVVCVWYWERAHRGFSAIKKAHEVVIVTTVFLRLGCLT